MTLQDELEWEAELSSRGSKRYWENQERLRKSGEADKGDAVSYLLHERMQEVADAIEQRAKVLSGRGAKYTKILRQVAQDDYLKLAFIGLQVIFQKTSMKRHNTLLKICLGIGSRLEADLKCQLFEAQNPAYYHTVIKSLKEQRVTDYDHKHKVLMKKFADFENLHWDNFEPEVITHLGLRVVDAILIVFSDVFFVNRAKQHNKQVAYIETTDQFNIWTQEFETARGLISPARLPLKIPPRDWNETMQGGYHSIQLAQTTQFIKTKSNEHSKYVKKHVPYQHRMAVNKIQRTPWKINERVLRVQEIIYNKDLQIGVPSNTKIVPPPFPAHLQKIQKKYLTVAQQHEVVTWKVTAKECYGNEQDRRAQVIAFTQSFKLAKELRNWEQFYYVYTCDFRGRIYCATAGLSPQGADTAKGILQFAKGLRLGESGVRWLAIQGANVYSIGNVTFIQRIRWVEQNEANIRHTVEDPIGNRSFWASADKPYQFLAFCYEWADCDYGRNKDALSSIPVGLDGSCNGLQHYSAMLRDEVGAKATNLTRCETPQDLYQEVSNKTTKIIQTVDHPWATKWTEVGIARNLAKRPTMTLTYGAKQNSTRQAIFKWALSNWGLFQLEEKHTWDMSKWLTPHLWAAIGTTVVAAREAMTWLQKNVGTDYCKWLTPIYFPVYQYYKEVPITRVYTRLCGMTELKLADLDRYGEPKRIRQRSGIAPNFIHSIDSTHMVMTINITDFACYAMIHDDFGTHAGCTHEMALAIRKAAHTLYTVHEPLKEWAEQVGADIETMPKSGTYDIDEILDAPYFFG